MTPARGSLDLLGAVTATLGIASVVFGLTSGNTNGWNAPVTLACFAAGAVLLVAFVVLDEHSAHPSCRLESCVTAAEPVPTR